jgi:tRNA-intron endonuclease
LKPNGQCESFLLGNRVVVFDYECANKIYWNGYYGTFLGVPKPRTRDVKAPLELSIVEAAYLVDKELIEVKEAQRRLSLDELIEVGKARVNRFIALYNVYKDLRRRGFIVRRGLKFGCDYLVYRHGPGIDHAPFGVLIYLEGEEIDPIELVRAGRLLHSVRKKLVLAISDSSKESVRYVLLDWWKP